MIGFYIVGGYIAILLYALLLDLAEINNSLEKKGYDKIYIEYQDYHNEYSPERTDPCPDYYGTYKIYSEGNQMMQIFILNVQQKTIHHMSNR